MEYIKVDSKDIQRIKDYYMIDNKAISFKVVGDVVELEFLEDVENNIYKTVSVINNRDKNILKQLRINSIKLNIPMLDYINFEFIENEEPNYFE